MELGVSNYTFTTKSGVTFYLDYSPDPNADFSNAWDTYFTNTLLMTRTSPGCPPGKIYPAL